mmetsp:Transcript_29252/g.46686  ORF Transcript_29252/g.46686 Transcript_29252/m.46686 type:complete len:95 (+) Transcript_29252:3-287(+)
MIYKLINLDYLLGGKKKKKKKIPSTPKKTKHKRKKEKLSILKIIKINSKQIKVNKLCPNPECVQISFLANHKLRKHCGKCGYSSYNNRLSKKSN